MGLLGLLVGLALLVLFAFRGWSVLLLAPFAALVAALFGGEPLLANLTQVFMVHAPRDFWRSSSRSSCLARSSAS